MPKSPNSKKLTIHLDLLKPQSNPEQILVKLMRWLLSSGRFIFVFVEALVLIAFVARFKLDADLAANKEAIDQQIPYIESLKSSEILIRQTQSKLSAISSFKSGYTDYSQILKKIADQTPTGVRIINLNLQKNVAIITLNLNGEALNNNELAAFVDGLRQDPSFAGVTIKSLGLEKNTLNFSVSAQVKSVPTGGKNL